MALTSQEEALIRQLLDQQAAILSLAGNEATITSKLGATKVTLADLVATSSVADADLLLLRQGTNDKSVTPLILKSYAQMGTVGTTGDQTIAGVKTFSSQVNGKPSGTDAIPAFSAETAGGALLDMMGRRAPFHSSAATVGSSYAPALSHLYVHDAGWNGIYSVGVANHGEMGPGSFVIHHINGNSGENFTWLFNGANGDFASPGSITTGGQLRADAITNALGTGAPNFPNGITVPNDSFSFAQLQDIPTGTILGRSSAGTGDIEGLSGAQATALMPAASETVSGRVELADATEAAAGTNGINALTPLRLRNALAATGSAPIYACRAWVNFNGSSTVAIRASGNVSSITDNGVGTYTVNFTTAMPDANYSIVSSCSSWSSDRTATVELAAVAVGSTQVRAGISGASAAAGFYFDPAIVTVAAFR